MLDLTLVTIGLLAGLTMWLAEPLFARAPVPQPTAAFQPHPVEWVQAPCAGLLELATIVSREYRIERLWVAVEGDQCAVSFWRQPRV